MTQGTTNTLDTVYTFDYDLYNDTLSEFHMSTGWLFVILLLGILTIALILLEYSGFAFIIGAIFAFFGIQMFNITILGTEDVDGHYDDNLRAYINEHQDEFDDSIATWLAGHDLTRDELCDSDTVINPDTLEPITADDTLICGIDPHSVQSGAFTLNGRDGAVVYGGEDHDRVVMSYRTPAPQKGGTA